MSEPQPTTAQIQAALRLLTDEEGINVTEAGGVYTASFVGAPVPFSLSVTRPAPTRWQRFRRAVAHWIYPR